MVPLCQEKVESETREFCPFLKIPHFFPVRIQKSIIARENLTFIHGTPISHLSGGEHSLRMQELQDSSRCSSGHLIPCMSFLSLLVREIVSCLHLSSHSSNFKAYLVKPISCNMCTSCQKDLYGFTAQKD